MEVDRKWRVGRAAAGGQWSGAAAWRASGSSSKKTSRESSTPGRPAPLQRRLAPRHAPAGDSSLRRLLLTTLIKSGSTLEAAVGPCDPARFERELSRAGLKRGRPGATETEMLIQQSRLSRRQRASGLCEAGARWQRTAALRQPGGCPRACQIQSDTTLMLCSEGSKMRCGG